MQLEAIQYTVEQTNISANQVKQVLTMMIEEECTIPFITRYRKERTGGLDEVQIANIKDKYDSYLEREKRRLFILESIKKLEQLTPELEKKILAAKEVTELEDIYAPFKSKKKTKGQVAKELGLLPLAQLILTTSDSIEAVEQIAKNQFLNEKIKNSNDAINGAKDIIIEQIAHDIELKKELRQRYWDSALMVTSKKKKAEEVTDWEKFKDYFDYSEPIKSLTSPKAGHRFLAIRRGVSLKILKADIIFDQEEALRLIENRHYANTSLGCRSILEECGKKAYVNYIHSSLDLEIKTELKKLADESAIETFKINLKNLLLMPYLGAKNVLGVDPGVRTGCKLAVVDANGNFIIDTVIYPHPPQNDTVGSAKVIATIIEKFGVKHIAVGNGTYGRETLAFLNENIKEIAEGKVKATLVSEAGASIYSASEIARREFPDKDPTVRGAISIARRFQDPLAELVKIDPKSIGVGQYQHDVNQAKLKKSLIGVVETCVNYVGVDLNTASAPLLSYVSGIGPTVAENIVKHRAQIGGFKNRQQLLEISRFSKKVFEQAAGFLRIYNGDNPLDGTFIHPERYPILFDWCKKEGISVEQLKENIEKLKNDTQLKEQLGEYTFNDIIKSLTAPSQDPRTEFKSTDFRKDVTSIENLKVGEWYPGIITNITQFGAFVDIGIKENGLLHISEMADTFVDDPHKLFRVGEEVKVKVLEVDRQRKRISLSCKTDSTPVYQPKERSNHRGSTKFKSKNNKPQEFKNNPFAKLKGLKVNR